ncbi:hypothetical protein KAR91_70440 [Candidatus Pacearchaeota archaeon]|nr:hypothetical protein [Candidatus Pacearchaeota archaeon]
MAIITIPISAAKNGGALYTLVDDLSNLNSEVLKYPEGDNLIIDYSGVTRPENKFNGDEAVILAILDNGGTIENYLFAIRQPKASASIEVPEGVISRTFLRGVVKIFDYWFGSGASLWLNNVTNEIMYHNQPNPADSKILTGAQSEIIRQLDPNADDPDPENRTYFFVTIGEAQAIVDADPNWVKL